MTVAGGASTSKQGLTIDELLRHRAAQSPTTRAFTFLSGDEAGAQEHITYGELDARARGIAQGLQSLLSGTESPRVVLCLPAGFDFLSVFLGCLYAGAVGAPVRCPHPKRSMDGPAGVAADCGASLGVTTPELVPVLSRAAPDIPWREVRDLESVPRHDTGTPSWATDPEAVAYLQYTSGSTSTPKGVVIRHRNIWTNCREMARHWSIDERSTIFSWLPHFHDMGLIFGLMEPIFSGCPGVLTSPMTFARRPAQWLEAISEFRVSHSCAPNFAFDTCSKLPASRLDGLDLSSWRVATNGAEPVRAETVERFIEHMEPFGFRAESLCPGYGLAENTLMTTSCRPERRAIIRQVSTEALKDRRLVPVETDGIRLTGSGPVDGVDTRISIIDPDTLAELEEGVAGEIWLSGPSVAGGYWQRPEATDEKFRARAADGDIHHLRTGDLGAVLDGELFVLGRMDDLMVIRGANHHPEDLEQTLEACHPALEPNGGAVFAVDRTIEPKLIVVHEIRRREVRRLDGDEVVRAMVAAVSESHELEVAAVVLLRPKTLPRTHSGKKQRNACRAGFRDGSLAALESWVAPKRRRQLSFGPPTAATTSTESEDSSSERNRAVIETQTTYRPEPTDPPVQGVDADAARDSDANDVVHWLRDYAEQRLNSRLMDERRSMPPYVALDLGNRGVLSLVAPKQYGGLDLSHGGLARVLEQLAAIDLTLASFVSVNNALGIRPILRYGTETRRRQVLPILGSGRELAAFAMTEPGAGSNVRAIAARGLPDGDSAWRLHGTKIWSGSAAWAGFINTFVQLQGDDGRPRGVTGFLLRQGSTGLRMGPEALTMGLRAMVQNKVFLEGVRVEADDLLGEPGKGMEVAMDTMEFGRFCLSALSLGVLKRCLQLMVRHGERRSIATGRLIANPVVRTRISDLTAGASAVEALIRLVAERLDRGLSVPPELYCACKTVGPELAWRGADLLVQQMAGRGFIETNLAPQILRDTRILRIFEGPTEPMNAFIGSRLVHSGDELATFLRDELGAPDLADDLLDATDRIHRRMSGPSSPFADDSSAAKSWTYIQVGEVACYTLLTAAARATMEPEKRRRTEIWLRRRWEQRLAEALDGVAAESVLLDEHEAREWVAGYGDDIGDFDQHLLGEDRRIDELIAGSPAATDTASPQTVSTEPPSGGIALPSISTSAPAQTNGRAEELSAWLKGWIARELGVSGETIDVGARFGEYGFDSVTSLKLANALEEKTGQQLSTTLVWDYPTLGHLIRSLTGEPAAPTPTVEKVEPPASKPTALPTDELSLLAQLDDLPEDQVQELLSRMTSEESPG